MVVVVGGVILQMATSIAPECEITSVHPHHGRGGHFNDSSTEIGFNPPRLRLAFMIRGVAMQTVRARKNKRDTCPLSKSARGSSHGGFACSYLANKSKVLWMRGE